MAIPGAARSAAIDNVLYLAHWLTLALQLCSGYHRLFLELGSRSYEALIIAAPTAAYLEDRPKRTNHPRTNFRWIGSVVALESYESD